MLTLAIVVYALIVGYTGRGAQPTKQPPQRAGADLAGLLKARYDSASRLSEIEEAKLEKGRSMQATVCEASRRVRDAGLEMSTSSEQRLDLLNTYLETTRRFERSVSNVVEKGFASASDKELAHYLRLDAEIALLKAGLAGRTP